MDYTAAERIAFLADAADTSKIEADRAIAAAKADPVNDTCACIGNDPLGPNPCPSQLPAVST
jgi:hypothetical protein